MWAWGNNENGQLGDNTLVNKNIPVLIGSGYSAIQAAGIGFLSFTSLCHSDHSLALKSDNTLWSWGSNDYGKLGIGSNTNSSLPKQVTGH